MAQGGGGPAGTAHRRADRQAGMGQQYAQHNLVELCTAHCPGGCLPVPHLGDAHSHVRRCQCRVARSARSLQGEEAQRPAAQLPQACHPVLLQPLLNLLI